MPTVRRATSNLVDLRPETDAKFHAPDFGGSGVGAGLKSLSRGVDAIRELAQEKEDQYSEAVATEQDTYATSEKNKLLYGEGGYFTLNGKAAMDALPTLQQRFGEIDAEAAGRLKGHRFAQELFTKAARQRNQGLEPRLLQHQSEQREVYLDQVDDGAIATSMDSAVNALDNEPEIGRQIATGESVVERKALRKGVTDPAALENQKQLYRTQVYGQVADRLNLTKGAVAAQDFIVRHAGEMDRAATTKLLAAIDDDANKEWSDSSVDGYLVHTGGIIDDTRPHEGAPTKSPNPPMSALEVAVASQESRNRDVDDRGRVVTSPKGAKGRMQVMDDTNKDPGYGVRPARDNSLEERARVGRDYLHALNKHYGNVTIALTAYNSGPGKVDKWLVSHGDPRKGQVTEAAWLQRLPIEESREYAPSVLARLGTRAATSGASPSTHTVPGNRDEIDLQATFGRIDADPELSFRQKETLKAAATRKHGIIKQANTEAEERVNDAAWAQVADMGEGFVSLNQLPPSLRTQLTGKQAEALNNKAEQNAVDAAYSAIEPLGDNFTNAGQIPNRVWEALPAQHKIQFRSMAEKNAEIVIAQRRVAAAIVSGAPLDPKDKKIREGVDSFYLAQLGQVRKSTNNDQQQLLRFVGDFTQRVGFVPDVVQSAVRGDLASSSPEANLRGARVLRAISARNPAALKDFAEDDIAKGVAINRYVDAGVTPAEALQKVELEQRISPAERTARGSQYEALTGPKSASAAVKAITEVFGTDVGGLTAQGAAGSQLVADFDVLRKQEFIRTGNMEAATATALQHLRRQWSVSHVNGKPELMKYAPEHFYGVLNDPDRDARWIREQAVDEMLANTLEEPGSDIRKRLRLIPHPTIPPVNGQPVYAGIIPWKDGSWHIMTDPRGRPKVFMPDFATSKEAKRIAAEQSRSIGSARGRAATRGGQSERGPTVSDAQLIP